MNEQLCNLLKITPGVVRFDCQMITHRDGMKLLEMRQFLQLDYIGKWVQVCKGVHKGDVGYVLSAESWGVCILLIPRLPPPLSQNIPPKRKRSHLRPVPALFDYKSICQRYGVMPDHVTENVYTFTRYTFEYGLIVKSYNFYSVSTTFPACHWICSPFFGKVNI